VLATVLFTDIVAPAGQAGWLGDRRWRQLLDVHHELACRVVEEFQGRSSRRPVMGFWSPSMVPTGDPLRGRTQRRTARDWAADPG
jgi:class 3 adenylate cyclase